MTPPSEDGIILEGVTRRSVLEVCRERKTGDVVVRERKVRMGEVASACGEGKMLEALCGRHGGFCCGCE